MHLPILSSKPVHKNDNIGETNKHSFTSENGILYHQNLIDSVLTGGFG